MHHHCDDDPVPVRIVPRGEYDGPDGEIRLAFDVWILKAFVVLLVIGNLLY